jgi:hypothetical protein
MVNASTDVTQDISTNRRIQIREIPGLVESRLPKSLWPFAGVILLYIVAIFIIPTEAPVGISDDWTYYLSVDNLVTHGRFDILSVSAATMVFQLFWGGLFGFIFGMSFGVLRMSTIVITLLGGLAVFGMARELGVRRERAALGMAVYLFNPILFAVTYSFMTDPHYLALLAMSSYFYLRGLRSGNEQTRYILYGAAIASLGVLQRPHAALIPFAVVLFLVLTRRLWFDRAGINRFLEIVALPAGAFLFYYLVVSRGLPSQQGLFLDDARNAGFQQTALLARRVATIEAVYTGFFLLPLALASFALVFRFLSMRSLVGWFVFLVFAAGLLWGAIVFWGQGRRMPYVPHFFGRGGPGSGDVRYTRPPLLGSWAWDLLTIFCIIASLIAVLAIIRAFAAGPSVERSGAYLLVTIGVFQAAGVVPQSLMFRNWIISLDRYLLPMFPFLVVLFLWAVKGERFPSGLAWVLTIAMAVFSIAGTRDALVFQDTVWGLASWLNYQGVPNTMIDAGYPWDAYHLWEYGVAAGITTPQTPDGTWWTDTYAMPTNSTYVVSGEPIKGYTTIAIQPFSAWLHESPQYLFILRRDGYPGTP